MTDDLLRAIDLALDDQWDAAHRLCQQHEGDPCADWIHAVLHKIEGDRGNAGYWYRRVDKLERLDAEPTAELREIRAGLVA